MPAMPRSPNLATPFAAVVAVRVPWSAPEPVLMLAVTTAPATATPAASFTVTAGWRLGSQTSRSSGLVGGWTLTWMAAGGPAAAASSDVGPSSGLVGSSPQETRARPRAAASASEVTW